MRYFFFFSLLSCSSYLESPIFSAMFYCTALQYCETPSTALKHCTAPHCNTLYCTALYVLHNTAIYCNAPSCMYCTSLQYIALHRILHIAQHCNILYCTAFYVLHNTRSYHTLVVDVYARCYIYRSRTEIFISCVGPTCSLSLAERFYRTRSKIFISWVGGQPVVYNEWSAANTSDIQQVDPLPS